MILCLSLSFSFQYPKKHFPGPSFPSSSCHLQSFCSLTSHILFATFLSLPNFKYNCLYLYLHLPSSNSHSLPSHYCVAFSPTVLLRNDHPNPPVCQCMVLSSFSLNHEIFVTDNPFLKILSVLNLSEMLMLFLSLLWPLLTSFIGSFFSVHTL